MNRRISHSQALGRHFLACLMLLVVGFQPIWALGSRPSMPTDCPMDATSDCCAPDVEEAPRASVPEPAGCCAPQPEGPSLSPAQAQDCLCAWNSGGEPAPRISLSTTGFQGPRGASSFGLWLQGSQSLASQTLAWVPPGCLERRGRGSAPQPAQGAPDLAFLQGSACHWIHLAGGVGGFLAFLAMARI